MGSKENSALFSMAQKHVHIHIYEQFRVVNWPNLHAFEL